MGFKILSFIKCSYWPPLIMLIDEPIVFLSMETLLVTPYSHLFSVLFLLKSWMDQLVLIILLGLWISTNSWDDWHSSLLYPTQPLLSRVIWGVISCRESVFNRHFTTSSTSPTCHGESHIFQEEMGTSPIRVWFDMKKNDAPRWILILVEGH